MEIPAAKFKATCLALMNRVALTGEIVVITKHGRPVAKLVAATEKGRRVHSGYGCMKGTVVSCGPDKDLFSTRESWKADR